MKDEEFFSPFYESFLSLCKREKISPTAAAKKAGISSGAPTAWKKGAVPKPEQRKKLCEIFGVDDTVLLGYKTEKPASQAGGGLIVANVLDDPLMLKTDNPVSVLMAQYMIPSDVMDILAGAKPGSSDAWKAGLGVPNKEQFRKIAEFFEIPMENLELGILPVQQSETVWGKLADKTEIRFPNAMSALKAVQNYSADPSDENYKALVGHLKGLSSEMQKKIIMEMLGS